MKRFHSVAGPYRLLPLLMALMVAAPILIAAPQAIADDLAVHISNEAQIQKKFLGITVRSKCLGASDLWIQGRRVATIENGRQIIVDLDRSLLTYIDHHDETFTEVPLPLDPLVSLSDEARDFQQAIQRDCEVKATGKTKKLLGYRCDQFVLEGWLVDRPDRPEASTTTVWGAAELDFDISAFQEYIEIVRELYNRTADCRRELLLVQGIQMQLEISDNGFPTRNLTTDRVLEITHELPPEKIFNAPVGYRQEERIRNLR